MSLTSALIVVAIASTIVACSGDGPPSVAGSETRAENSEPDPGEEGRRNPSPTNATAEEKGNGSTAEERSVPDLLVGAMALGITTLVLLLFLVRQMRNKVVDLIMVADEKGHTELLLVTPLREELEKLRKNQKTVGENIKKNFGAVQGHLKGTQEAVGQLEEEMQSIRELANARTREIELYQEGIRLSSLKDAMGQVIKSLDFIREGVRATAGDGRKAPDALEVADHLEAILKEALFAAGVDEYGEEVIGDPIEDHGKDCKAIPNERTDPEHGPGKITSCVRSGYRVLVKPGGEYFSLRVAEVTVNPSTEHEQPTGEESA